MRLCSKPGNKSEGGAGANKKSTATAATADIDGCGAGADGAEDAGELDDAGTVAVTGDGAEANAAGVHGGHGRVAVEVAVAVERTNQRPLRKVGADYKKNFTYRR